MTENLDRLRKLLAYYGNLDKTTVLALIDRVEAAERSLVELQPAEVLVEGSYFPVADLPAVLRNFMRASEESAREAKAYFLRAEAAEAAVQRVREFLEYRKGNSAIAREALRALDGGDQE